MLAHGITVDLRVRSLLLSLNIAAGDRGPKIQLQLINRFPDSFAVLSLTYRTVWPQTIWWRG